MTKAPLYGLAATAASGSQCQCYHELPPSDGEGMTMRRKTGNPSVSMPCSANTARCWDGRSRQIAPIGSPE